MNALNSQVKASKLLKSNYLTSSELKEMNYAQQLETINNSSFFSLNSIIRDEEITHTFSEEINSRLIKDQNQLFQNRNTGSILEYINENENIVSQLSDRNLINLLHANKPSDTVLNEVKQRIKDGKILFNNYNYKYKNFGLDFDINLMAFSNLPETIRTEILSQIQKEWDIFPTEYKSFNYGKTFFQQAVLAKMVNNDLIDFTSLNKVFELAKTNPNLLETFNFEVLNKEIVAKLGVDTVLEIGKFDSFSMKLVELYENNPHLFEAYKEQLSKAKQDNSLNLFYLKNAYLLDFYFDNANILETVDSQTLMSDAFLNYIFYNQNKYSLNAKKIEIDFDSNYNENFIKKCDELFQLGDITNMKEALFQKYFSLSSNEVREIINEYINNFEQVSKYDDHQVIEILKTLKYCYELQDVHKLSTIYNSLNFNYNSVEMAYFFNNVENIYRKSYVENLSHTLSTIQNKINNREYETILFNGKEVKKIVLSEDFEFIVHSSETGYTVTKTLLNDSYIDTWNVLRDSETHGLSTSYITSEHIGLFPVGNTGVYYGFLALNENQVKDISAYDLNSNIANYGFTSNNKKVFVGANDISKMSTRVYNEIVLDRTSVTPDCVLIFSDMPIELKNNAYKAASEWNIPVIEINKEFLAKQQMTKIDSLLYDYELSGNVNSLSEAIERYEMNVSGYKLNKIESFDDFTTGIDNSQLASIMDSKGIENQMMIFIDSIKNGLINKSDASIVLNKLKSIKNNYEIAN